MYAWLALDLLQSDPPVDVREALGAVLLCAVLSSMWPPVLLWRMVMGPAGQRMN